MPTVHLSQTEARRAGLIAKPTKRTRTGTGRGGAVSVCATCGETFTSDTRETAHLEQTGHGRYVTPLEEGTDS